MNMPLQTILIIQTLKLCTVFRHFVTFTCCSILIPFFFVLTSSALSLPLDLFVQVLCHRLVGDEDL